MKFIVSILKIGNVRGVLSQFGVEREMQSILEGVPNLVRNAY